MKENKNLVIFDVETTGISKQLDWIIQLSAIKIDKKTLKVIDEFDSYVIPAGQWVINPAATEINGLTEDFIKKNGKTLKEIGPKFIEFCEGADMGGYNSNTFDIMFLYKDFTYSGLQFDFDNRTWYDVYVSELRLHPNNLGNVFQRYYNKTMEDYGLDAHNSLSDVKATWGVLSAQLKTHNLTLDEMAEWNENQMLTPDGSIRNAARVGDVSLLVMTKGKYKDIDVYEVMKQDPDYMRWWAEKVASKYTLGKVREYCIRRKKEEELVKNAK